MDNVHSFGFSLGPKLLSTDYFSAFPLSLLSFLMAGRWGICHPPSRHMELNTQAWARAGLARLDMDGKWDRKLKAEIIDRQTVIDFVCGRSFKGDLALRTHHVLSNSTVTLNLEHVLREPTIPLCRKLKQLLGESTMSWRDK